MLYIKLILLFSLMNCSLFSQEKEKPELPKKYLNSQGMMMLYVKGGTYTMGTDKIYAYYEKMDIKDFRPAHKVTLSPFYMAKFEVTKGMFKAFAKETGIGDDLPELDPKNKRKERKKGDILTKPWGSGPSLAYPVVNINWYYARDFCKWLSKKEGRKYRLPTEAEWEYVVRADTKTLYWWGDEYKSMMFVDRYASYRETTFPKFWIGGTFPANPRGFYDMYSNASEWCIDSYKQYRKNNGVGNILSIHGVEHS